VTQKSDLPPGTPLTPGQEFRYVALSRAGT